MNKNLIFLIPIVVLISLSFYFSNNQAFAFSKADNLLVYNIFNNTNCASAIADWSIASGASLGLGVSATSAGVGSCNFDGIIDRAVDGTNDYGTLGNGSKSFNWLHDGRSNWSINFWFNSTGQQLGSFPFNGIVFQSAGGTGATCDTTKGVRLALGTGDNSTTRKENYMQFCVGDGSQLIFTTKIHKIVNLNSGWSMFTVTFNPSSKTMQLYVNGILNRTITNSTSGGFSTGDSSRNLYLSSVNPIEGGGGSVVIYEDEFSYWNTILTNADINLLYNSTHAYSLLSGNGLTTTLILTPDHGPVGTNVSVEGTGFSSSTYSNQRNNYDSAQKINWDGNIYATKFTSLTPSGLVNTLQLKVSTLGTGTFARCTFNCSWLGETNDPPLTGWNGNVFVNKFLNLQVGSPITSVQLNITSATGNIRIKIYNSTDSSTSATPTNLIGESGPYSISSTGLQNFALSNVVVPKGGAIWAGFEVDSASSGLTGGNFNNGGQTICFRISHTYGSGPDPYGSGSDCAGLGYRTAFMKVNQNYQSSFARIKIYQDDGASGGPATLLGESSPQQITGTGLQNFTVSANVPASGNIWGAFETNNTETGFRYDVFSALLNTCKTVSHTYGTGPSPFGTISDCSPTSPYMKLYYSPIVITVSFKYDGTTISTSPSTVTTNSTGGFSGVTFTVPASTTGLHYLNATDSNNNFRLGAFTVDASTLTLTPNNGPSNTVIIYNGTGFNPSETVDVYIDGIFAFFGTSTSGGIFNGSFFLGDSTSGSHTINATDEGSPAHSATATFTTSAPVLTLVPNNGSRGDTITMSGLNFSQTVGPYSYHVNFTFNGSPLVTSPVTVHPSSSGTFSGVTFVVPNLVAGTYTVNATDHVNSDTFSFTINHSGITQGTLTISGSQAGNTVTISPSVLFSRPSNVYVNDLKLYQGISLIQTYTYSSPFLVHANSTTSLHNLIQVTTSNSTWHVTSEVTNETGTSILTSNSIDVNFYTSFNNTQGGFICPTGYTCTNGVVTGGSGGQTITNGTVTHGGIIGTAGPASKVFYTYNRNSTFTGLTVTVIRNPVPWNLECRITTGLFGDASWINVTQVGSFNRTVAVDKNTNYNWQCFGSGQILQFTSYGISNGTAAFKTYTTNFGDFFGVPLPFLMVVMVAAIATGRSAPTMIIILGITFGALIFFGLLTLAGPIYFVIVTVLVVIGALVGKKIF